MWRNSAICRPLQQRRPIAVVKIENEDNTRVARHRIKIINGLGDVLGDQFVQAALTRMQ